MMKLRRSSPSIAAAATGRLGAAATAGEAATKSKLVLDDDDRVGPEKCVMINVLAEPPPGSPIRADVIFIHGLHGEFVDVRVGAAVGTGKLNSFLEVLHNFSRKFSRIFMTFHKCSVENSTNF